MATELKFTYIRESIGELLFLFFFGLLLDLERKGPEELFFLRPSSGDFLENLTKKRSLGLSISWITH